MQEEEIELTLMWWALRARGEIDLIQSATQKIIRAENVLPAVLISSAVATFSSGGETRYRAARVTSSAFAFFKTPSLAISSSIANLPEWARV